ncbi:MAG: hypothetical protein RLZZ502_1378, partial [Pseudomonadota bacterium]
MRPSLFLNAVSRLGMAFLLSAVSLLGHAATSVQRFTPVGEAKNTVQVTARFSGHMVRLGDPRQDDPFIIKCPQTGQGRWIDTHAWAYEFSRPLRSGLNCSFALKPELKDVAGEALSGTREFSFFTGVPVLLDVQPHAYDAIEEDQLFIMAFDAPVSDETLRKALRCESDKLPTAIAISPVAGPEKEKILETVKKQRSYFMQRDKDRPEKHFSVFKCAQRLAADSGLRLRFNDLLDMGKIKNDKNYQVRAEFSAKLECTRLNARANCAPVAPVVLQLSTPVPKQKAAQMFLQDAAGKKHPASFDADSASVSNVSSVYFAPPFDAKQTAQLHLGQALTDESGRALANAQDFPMKVVFDEMPPLVKFSGRFGILERGSKDAPALLPVHVRNIEPMLKVQVLDAKDAWALGDRKSRAIQGKVLRVTHEEGIRQWYESFQASAYEDDGEDKRFKALLNSRDAGKTINLPTRADKALETIGIPLTEPGFYLVEVASPKLASAYLDKPDQTYYVRTSVLVTNMSVHLKYSEAGALAWVTSLDKGQPVSGAEVTLWDCQQQVLWRASTNDSGVAKTEKLARPADSCKDKDKALMLTARLADDLSFVMSNWNEGIRSWDFGLPDATHESSKLRAHTILNRSLLKAGESVHMKHLVRGVENTGFSLASWAPKKVVLQHLGSDTRYEFDNSVWHEGSATASVTIPKEAKEGLYDVLLGDRRTASVRVQTYRLPFYQASLSTRDKLLVNPKNIAINAQLRLLAGGTAAGLPVQLYSRYERYTPRFDSYEDFSFGAELVRTGSFSSEQEESQSEADNAPSKLQREKAQNTNAAGASSWDIAPPSKNQLSRQAQSLVAEISYADPNGQIQSAGLRATVWPSAVVLGIKAEPFVSTRSAARPNVPLTWRVLAVTTEGKPLAKQAIVVEGFTRQGYSVRKRLLGGFYGYEDSTAVKSLGTLCEGQSDELGMLLCQTPVPSLQGAELLLQANSKDSEGNQAYTNTRIFLAGQSDWGPALEHDRMDVIAEKKQLKAGEKARLRLHMPFREATVLLTVEREGVRSYLVKQVSRTDPVVEVPIAVEDAPNVVVTALAVRGRAHYTPPSTWERFSHWWRSMLHKVGLLKTAPEDLEQAADYQHTALADLAKPSFKLGMTELKVSWEAHKINVAVKTEKPSYAPRDTAKVELTLSDAQGKPLNGEAAVAVIDEALLQLSPNRSWEVLEAMMQQRMLSVQTATAGGQVIGKRVFGAKAVPVGGDGAVASSTRSVFDPAVFWQATVRTDANGRAQLEVPLKDALSRFRVVAVATQGANLFGTGSGSFTTTQSLQLFSSVAPVLRSGDATTVAVMIKNASEQNIEVDLDAQNDAGIVLKEPSKKIKLAKDETQQVMWPVTLPKQAGNVQWTFSARSEKHTDRISVSQQIVSAYPPRVVQATLAQLDGQWQLPLTMPSDNLDNSGGVEVGLSAKLAGNVGGIKDFFLK